MTYKPTGRPTKLTPELMEKASGYLDWVKTQPILTSDGKEVERTPKLISLARYLGIDKNTVTNLRKVSEEFNNICDGIQDAYEECLIDHGLAGNYQPRVATFLLSADIGKREKTDVTTDGQAINVSITSFKELKTDGEDNAAS